MIADGTNGLDPMASPTTAEDDPLRAWFANLNDPGMAALLITDPEKAKELMASRGIAPPPHASSYMGSNVPGSNILGYDPGKDPTRAGNPGNPVPVAAPGDPDNPIRTLPNGKISGNITAPVDPDAVPPVAPPKRAVAAASPLDPEEEASVVPSSVPLPARRPEEAGPGASDLSARSKTDKTAEALSGFSKSLAGVKPVPPPPLNAVGTPSVRSPGAIGAPNITNLLALAGQQAQARQLQTLGRLLVAGKA